MADCVNCRNFVISKIVVGFVVGGSGIILFIDGGDLTSFTVLVNGFQLDGESHGLVKQILVGFHDTASDWLVEAREKQLMLEKLFSISDTFSLAFCEVGRSDGNGQRGDVGGDHSEGRDVGRLFLRTSWRTRRAPSSSSHELPHPDVG